MRTNPRHIIPGDATPPERSATIIPFAKSARDDAASYRSTRRSNEMIDFFRAQLACADSAAEE